MHILVTGGAGFIGSQIVEYHLEKGDQVFAVDDLTTGSMENVKLFSDHPNYRFEEADIITWQNIEKSVSWADRVYHMAAVVGVYRVLAEPIRVVATNIAGCERVLRAAAASGWKPQILIASSSEVYGHSDKPGLNEEDNLIIESGAHARWNYSISKLADETLGLAYYQKLGLPVTLARFFNTIGPRQTGRYGMVVPRFVQQANNNEPITVFGDGEQTRCFCDVRDTVAILDILLSNDKSLGQIVNVGNNREINITQLAELVKKIAGSKSKIEYIPYDKAYGQQFNDIQHRKPDLTKLLSLTHYQYQWTLENTIKDLLQRERTK